LSSDLEDLDEAGRLQQYEIVWVLPRQYGLATRPAGFALEVVDFLGPGDPDFRGEPTVWVRGPIVDADRSRSTGTVAVRLPHDQPRARTGGAVLPPPIPGAFDQHHSPGPA
jgi:hypothetical protein